MNELKSNSNTFSLKVSKIALCGNKNSKTKVARVLKR